MGEPDNNKGHPSEPSQPTSSDALPAGAGPPTLTTYSACKKVKPLSFLPLVALIFYEVSGGPFGIEDAVSTGGPLLAILGFCILPLVWSVPEALITAELATTFPENSGYVAWVTAAFGPFWGFQEGFYSWLSGVTDNSVYPVMFLSYLERLIPGFAHSWHRTVLLFAFAIGLAYLNYRGLTIVGRTAIAMTVFIIAPFVLMTFMALPQIDPAKWLVVDMGAVQWGPFLNVMFWNLNYWDSVSTLAGEVAEPHRTFPKALFSGVVLVVAAYVVPLLVGLGVTTTSQVDDWKLGYFTEVGQLVGGKFLAGWVVAAAACSQIGQFEAEMSSDSFQLQGMAERGFLPAAFARRSRYDTPTLAITLSSVGILAMAHFDFQQIVELLNAIYCLAELMEFAAFVWLRIKAPNLMRPYRVPLPTWGVALMLLPASLLLVTLLLMPIFALDWRVMQWTGGAMVTGALLYPLLRLARQRKWCKFCEMSPEDFHAGLYNGLPVAEVPVPGCIPGTCPGDGFVPGAVPAEAPTMAVDGDDSAAAAADGGGEGFWPERVLEEVAEEGSWHPAEHAPKSPTGGGASMWQEEAGPGASGDGTVREPLLLHRRYSVDDHDRYFADDPRYSAPIDRRYSMDEAPGHHLEHRAVSGGSGNLQ